MGGVGGVGECPFFRPRARALSRPRAHDAGSEAATAAYFHPSLLHCISLHKSFYFSLSRISECSRLISAIFASLASALASFSSALASFSSALASFTSTFACSSKVRSEAMSAALSVSLSAAGACGECGAG